MPYSLLAHLPSSSTVHGALYMKPSLQNATKNNLKSSKRPTCSVWPHQRQGAWQAGAAPVPREQEARGMRVSGGHRACQRCILWSSCETTGGEKRKGNPLLHPVNFSP